MTAVLGENYGTSVNMYMHRYSFKKTINPERNPGRMIIMHMGSVGTKYKKSVDPGHEI